MDDPDPAPSCIVVGGGPAGVMLALLLARKGVAVALLEMHRDFERDFRGDTVHASTLEVLDQIGLADPLHELPHARMTRMRLHSGGRAIEIADLSRLRTRFPYVMMMPQALFLTFLCERARQYAGFRALLGAAVTGLLHDADGTCVGVRYRQAGREHELHAPLVVAADGRLSRLRRLAGVEGRALSTPMDVAWLRVARAPQDEASGEAGGFYVHAGGLVVMLRRPDAWQIGYVFASGGFRALRARGIGALREALRAAVPWLGDRVEALRSFHDVHLLKVAADRLPCWHRPGLLFIGDAAHVMSPVGGIGINQAIGDAVEAANVLTAPLLAGTLEPRHLARVQARREKPTRRAQHLQGLIQRNVVARALRGGGFELPLPARVALRVPGLRDLPARLVAHGFGRTRLEAP